MTDNADTGNSVVVTVGCDPVAEVFIKETDNGNLFVVVRPADPTAKPLDFDGVFFDLSDDSTLGSLNFSPEPNTGSIFSPVTSVQAAADSVNSLSNGAQVAQDYDIGVQFGTVDGSTQGEVPQANFTLFSDDGPLSLSDLDLDSFAVVVDSDGGNGQVLTTGDTPDADPVFVSTEVLFDDFDDIYTPSDSSIVESNDGWVAAYDKLVTNGANDGTLTFNEVATEGPVSLILDLTTHNTYVFENSGQYADSLRIEVRLDNGEWVLLDEYQVNDAGTALVGSETGQSFDASGATVTYSGGVLDDVSDTAQFRIVSDISANNEVIKVDNVSVTATQEVDGVPAQPVETVLLSEDFEDINDPAQSDAIVRDGRWDVRDGELVTDGHNDGVLRLAPVEAEGDVEISFDARVNDPSLFENGGVYGDKLLLQVRLDDGSWTTLDKFEVNADGTALVGDRTGNEIVQDDTSLTYQGGILDDVSGEVEFRFVSNISASNEQITLDNIEVTATQDAVVTEPHDPNTVMVDFNDASAGDVVADQFQGVTVSAQRNGDADDSENDAMIFDTNAPTGGDTDLSFSDQGNAVIISEDNDSSDPDDNAGGGTISFDFEVPSEVVSLNILDVEEAGGSVDLFNADGDLLQSLDIPATGDNSLFTLDINVAGVSAFDVNLVGSGAVDDLKYIPEGGGDDKAGQYDVEYIAGVPLVELPEEETSDDVDEDDLLLA